MLYPTELRALPLFSITYELSIRQILRLVFRACSLGGICEPFGQHESSLAPRSRCSVSTFSQTYAPRFSSLLPYPPLAQVVKPKILDTCLNEGRLERTADALKRSAFIREDMPCDKTARSSQSL